MHAIFWRVRACDAVAGKQLQDWFELSNQNDDEKDQTSGGNTYSGPGNRTFQIFVFRVYRFIRYGYNPLSQRASTTRSMAMRMADIRNEQLYCSLVLNTLRQTRSMISSRRA